MPDHKLVGFDISKIVDDIGENWSIVSIDGISFPVQFLDIPTITNWPNSGDLVLANLPGEDGDLWLKQSIVDYENEPPTPPNGIVMVIKTNDTEVEYNIDSVDFIGGRPQHRPGT